MCALASVLSLVALSGAAAGLSLATSPPVPDYGLLPANDPAASASLRQAVEATVASPNFTVEVRQVDDEQGPFPFSDTENFEVVYQSPNRVELHFEEQTFIDFGSQVYEEVQPGPGGATNRRWEEWSADEPSTGLDAAQVVATLSLLSSGQSVQRSTDTYHSESFGAFQASLHSRSGSNVTTVTAIVRGGHVVSESFSYVTTAAVIHDILSFSGFGTSPPVLAPPSAEVVRSMCPGTFVPPYPNPPRGHGPCSLDLLNQP